ncbi:MAG: PAS domain S-box protein [Campylobacterales bacterium]|nr:PAS domain S-box protein [Campylobacterales bacterium]
MNKYSDSDAISKISKTNLRKEGEKISSESEAENIESLQVVLDEEKKRYFELYDLAPVGYCTLNEKDIILQSNLTAATLLETTKDELVKRSFSAFIFSEDLDIYSLFRKKMRKRGKERGCVLRMVKKDGRPFWGHVAATAVVEDDRTELRIVFYDMTKRKEAEIALHESEIKYQLLADYAKECIFLMDANGNYLYISPACEDISGYKPEEFLADASLMTQIIHPDDRDAYQHHLDHLPENDISEMEFRIVCRDGSQRWFSHYSNAIYDKDGLYLGRRGSNRDITEKKKMELTLVDSEAKLLNVTSSVQDAIIMIDNDGKIICWNEAAHRITGYLKEEVMGRELHRFLAPEQFYADYEKGFANFRTTGEWAAIGKPLELTALHKEGYEIPIELSLSALKLNGLWCAVAILRDISERKNSELKLRASEFAESIINTVREPLIALDQDLRVVTVSRSFYEFFKVKPEETVGELIYDLGNKQWNIPKLRELLETILPQQTTFDDYESGLSCWRSRTLQSVER